MRDAQKDLGYVEVLLGFLLADICDFIFHNQAVTETGFSKRVVQEAIYKLQDIRQCVETFSCSINRATEAESWLKHLRSNYNLDPVDNLMISKFLQGEKISEDEAIQQIHGCDAETFYGGGQG